jgi:hypothetical protein
MTLFHTCNWPGCGTQVQKSAWACNPHWLRLPPELRIELWESYASPYKFAEISLAVKAWVHERNFAEKDFIDPREKLK